MDSRKHLLQQPAPYESPAKVFARLKSMVHGGTCPGTARRHGAGPEAVWTGDIFNGDLESDSDGGETLALTISPNRSPQGDDQNEEQPRQHGRTPGHLPRGRPGPLESAHLRLLRTSCAPAGTQPGPDVSMEEYAPLYSQDGPYSPMRKRLRERSVVPRVTGYNTRRSSSRMDELRGEALAHQQVGETFVPSEDEPEMEPSPEPVPHPPACNLKKCYVSLGRNLPMSPAKIFACMKQNENKQDYKINNNNSSRRDLFNVASSRLTREEPPTTGCNIEENKVSERELSSERASRPLETEPSDVPPPAARVLLDDPLFLKSPQVSIPNKRPIVTMEHKPNRPSKTVLDSKIYLQKWFLRKNSLGLFVDGINQKAKINWNSNIIKERISNNVLKTVTNKTYVLLGQMNLEVNCGFPRWFLKEFYNGFPSNWETLYERLIPKAKGEKSSAKRGRHPRGNTTQDASINVSVQWPRENDSNMCGSSATASLSLTKVSRSGRILKPPLEYWKGGRVLVDAEMNVTVHTCYDTILGSPEDTTTVSARASEKPFQEPRHHSEGNKQHKSLRRGPSSVPLRKAKSPRRKRSRSRPVEKPQCPPEPPVEPLSSPDQWSNRRPWSQRKQPAAKRTQHADTMPKQSHYMTRHKRTVTTPPESSSAATSPDESSPEFPIQGRRKRSQPRRVSTATSSNSEEDQFCTSGGTRKSRAAQRKKRTELSKCTKKSQVSKALPKSRQSGKKPGGSKNNAGIPQMPEEDKWTEAELALLQQAVSLYPKHVASYWEKVAKDVGTRSAAECFKQHTSHGATHSPAKKTRKPIKKKSEAPKEPGQPVISARVGTLKRKQQVRDFLENMPRDDVEDAFSSAYMQNRRAEIPSMCPSDDADFTLQMLEPVTPTATAFPEVKTPQCLHITPGMMGSPNGRNNDRYVYQLQKRMRKQQFNVCQAAVPAKKFSPTPSRNRTMRRFGTTEDDNFVVWEMFPDKDKAPADSEEEEDFYFSDSD